jgi:molybdopterin/thiamine biosynthesis adenylyltransferase/proteasome lid subunit RPN8/RPN11
MRYTMTFTEELMDKLTAAIFADYSVEGAAYLLCGVGSMVDEIRLLSREVIPVRPQHYAARTANRLSIDSDSYASVAKQAMTRNEAIVFVHSHPEEVVDFSLQDDREEPKVMAFFQSRIPEIPHGSMVFSTRDNFRARIWSGYGWHTVERIRIIGRRFRFVDSVEGREPIADFYDRNVSAFGFEIQRLLRTLHVGVVGAGGTGSAVVEQLARLGAGKISIFDGENLEASNVTRVHGSGLAQIGIGKAALQQMHVTAIGLKSNATAWQSHINDEITAKRLRECDVVFGCTDMQGPRATLVRLALWYLIPVFDMATKVQARDGIIRTICGCVTTLFPSEACLFCRGRIDPAIIRAESLPEEQRDREIEEGYITGLETDEPAVVMFTTSVAAQAVIELLHRLTGFMGEDRVSSEILMLFNDSRVRTNRQTPLPDCICQRRNNWGLGDTRDFLGKIW